MANENLNLPRAELKVVEREGKRFVWDILRRRYVRLTPEEWVRQLFVHFLIDHKHYPTSVIGNEVSIHLYGTSKRCDSVVYDDCARPLMIIEYKAPEVEITQRVFEQIGRYNIRLRVRWLVVSNGLQHFCCRVDYENNRFEYVADIPEYGCALRKE